MFYSHEILTSREHGVATIWLMATLGSRTVTKKVNRKAIIEVNVPKACETIVSPAAPMALRLQGNLLYGVSKVYSQQCVYMLNDVQSFRDRMRTLLNAIVSTQSLDPEAGRARPDLLILPNDPTFLPEYSLMAFELDFINATSDASFIASPRSSSILSPHYSQTSSMSSYLSDDASLLQNQGLGLSSSRNSADVFAGDGFPSSSRTSGAPHGALDNRSRPQFRDLDRDEEEGFIMDADFEFDADGNIVELPVPGGRSHGIRTTPTPMPREGGMYGQSESEMRRRVMEEHLQGLKTGIDQLGDRLDLGEDNFVYGDEEFLPIGEVVLDAHQLGRQEASPQIENEVEMEVHRPLKRKARELEMDHPQELTNRHLAEWRDNYLDSMRSASRQKDHGKMATQSKHNAAFWVLGQGLGGVGIAIGTSDLRGPLAETFSSEGLYTALTGKTLSGERNKERRRGEDEDEELYIGEDGALVGEVEDQIGRGMQGDEGIEGLGDNMEDGFEIGRNVSSPVLNDDVSAQMPWNSDIFSHRGSSALRGAATSLGLLSSTGAAAAGKVSTTISRNRIPSSSPLAGRGRRLRSLDIIDVQDGSISGDDFLLGDMGDFGSSSLDELNNEADFQLDMDAMLNNEAANTTTSFHPPSYSTLDKESKHFYNFILAHIEAENTNFPADNPKTSTSFSKLIPVKYSEKKMAAQAFLNVLSLVTKGFLMVGQYGAFEEIGVMVVEGVLGDDENGDEYLQDEE